MIVRGIRAFVLRDLVDAGLAIPQRPWVRQGGASAPGGATHGPLPQGAVGATRLAPRLGSGTRRCSWVGSPQRCMFKTSAPS